ncbi:GIY-YIG nuclease family protein [Oleiharenicola lentus]|uniref:GIY-YIG nuclease family protein n=1 Tax=Oleiharenicola lentus TaxID=2508720 RepID=UPI001C552030|nr:GIY-YIG nuclease family protein [Oleiharenicola lentus]
MVKAAAPKPNGCTRASVTGLKNDSKITTGRITKGGFADVHILESLASIGGFYVGLTDDLTTRLAKHISGGVPHMAKHRAWCIKTAVAFRDRNKAAAFDKYLKSASGGHSAESDSSCDVFASIVRNLIVREPAL